MYEDNSTLIHAAVLCESAQRYRALIVILQSHRTQNMILRCHPSVSAIYTPGLQLPKMFRDSD